MRSPDQSALADQSTLVAVMTLARSTLDLPRARSPSIGDIGEEDQENEIRGTADASHLSESWDSSPPRERIGSPSALAPMAAPQRFSNPLADGDDVDGHA